MMTKPALSNDIIERLIVSLITAELKEARSWSLDLADTADWSAETSLGEDGLALDSLDLLAVAGRINQFFHLHEVGIEDYLLRDRTIGRWVEIVNFSMKEKWERVTFQTSGSTGTPKPCTHELDLLMQEVAALRRLFPDTGRIIALAPPHHIYGFIFTILLPNAITVPVLDGRLMAPGKLASQLNADDVIVSFPTVWKYLSRSLDHFPEGCRGITSTAPMPQHLADQLREQGLSCLYEIYGSSETAGIGWRADSATPYRLFDYWHRDGDEGLTRIDPHGEKLTGVFAPDILLWESHMGDNNHFRPIKRKDNAVQVGGINVFPERIASIIREHPKVVDCTVRPSDGENMDCLKAFIVLGHDDEPPADFLSDLQSWCRERLQPMERPRLFSFGTEIPQNDFGKAANW